MNRDPASSEFGFTLLEEWLHSISHGIGALLSLAGMITLILLASLAPQVDVWKVVAVSLYGATLVLLYTASTLYHATQRLKLKRLYRLLDHCAIYALIAGSYTPFLLVNLRHSVGWTLLTIIWALALAGIVLKLVWPKRFGVLHVIVYLAMGWLIVSASGELGEVTSETGLSLLVAGGLAYTGGVLFFAIRAIPYNHAIWHLFVIAGSVCHYLAVYTDVLPYQA
ncbi:hemolysin III family protein [Halomonas sp. TRM85114]|uniref:PAQR family membrane homeostasis protein TrhA n=1 Tax=Halomonas jincaotanensis TaxID=2810616 RepID=UPI001BD4F193|nr:hemolysin III family protein [Halomonas jincaotanensis]MBS9404619.1 hemolysin III family protein [Halomonas jincaotanensis]